MFGLLGLPEALVISVLIVAFCFTIAVTILSILVPFFVLKIRNQVIEINKTLKIVSKRLIDSNPPKR